MKFPHIKYLKTSIFFLLLFSFCAYLGSFIFSYDAIFEQYNPLLFSDVARIQPEKILSIDRVNSTNQIREIILDASRR